MVERERLIFRIIDTILTCACHMGTGINLGIVCQTLIDLERWTESTTEGIAAVFTWRGVGILFSCLTMSQIYHYIHHDIVLGFCVLLCGLCTFLVPFTHSLVGVSVILGLQGVPSGLVFIGNLLVLGSSWKNPGPFLQLMYLGYALGMMIAQWLAKPFTSFITIHHLNESQTLSYKDLVDISSHTSNGVVSNYSYTEEVLPMNGNSTMIVEAVDMMATYMLTGLVVMVIGIFTLAYVFHHCTWRQVFRKKLTPSEKAKQKANQPLFDTALIIKAGLIVVILNFQFALETAYLGLLVTFVVRQLSWDKTSSMFIVSILTICGLVSRALAALLSKWLPPKMIIIFDVTIAFVSSVILSLFVMSHPSVMWVCSAGITVSCATAGPAILAWASQEIPPSVKVNAAYMTTCATNLFLGPTVIGFFFHAFSPMFFCYMTTLYALIVIILFIISVLIFRYLNKRKADKEVGGPEFEALDVKPTEEL